MTSTSAPKSRTAATSKPREKNTVWADLVRDKYLYLLALPGLLYLLIFKYIPIGGIIIAFQNYSPYMGIMDSQWVGFEHFHSLFTEDDFWMLFRNTMAISLLNLVFFFPFPIVLALLLNELRHMRSSARSRRSFICRISFRGSSSSGLRSSCCPSRKG